MNMIYHHVNLHDMFVHVAVLFARYLLTDSFRMGTWQMMRYSHCKNKYGDVLVRACGTIVVSWTQHVDPTDPDNILVTWYYGMTNAWLTSFMQKRRKIQVQSMLRILRNHLGNMKFHSGRVCIKTMYPFLDLSSPWNFPEEGADFLEGPGEGENDQPDQTMDLDLSGA